MKLNNVLILLLGAFLTACGAGPAVGAGDASMVAQSLGSSVVFTLPTDEVMANESYFGSPSLSSNGPAVRLNTDAIENLNDRLWGSETLVIPPMIGFLGEESNFSVTDYGGCSIPSSSSEDASTYVLACMLAYRLAVLADGDASSVSQYASAAYAYAGALMLEKASITQNPSVENPAEGWWELYFHLQAQVAEMNLELVEVLP